jgi:hypothetical protein
VKERKPPAAIAASPFKKGGIACHGLTSKKGGIFNEEVSLLKLSLLLNRKSRR